MVDVNSMENIEVRLTHTHLLQSQRPFPFRFVVSHLRPQSLFATFFFSSVSQYIVQGVCQHAVFMLE